MPGSLARRLLHLAPCPVLAIPAGAKVAYDSTFDRESVVARGRGCVFLPMTDTTRAGIIPGMKTATELLRFVEERSDDSIPNEPAFIWDLNVGRLRWVSDPRNAGGGAWMLAVGAHDRPLLGIPRSDQAEALELSRRFVGEYMSNVAHHYVD
jgi:hypothetical protein